MRQLVSSGRVHLRDLLDLVSAVGPEPAAVEDAIRHVYDWHNGRSVAAMQLTFAPVAGAILAIVAKPNSTLVVVGGAVVVLLGLALGVVQLLTLNWLHGEYVSATRLAAELCRFHNQLDRYPHGLGAPAGSAAQLLYMHIGSVSMVDYRAKDTCREFVLSIVADLASRPG